MRVSLVTHRRIEGTHGDQLEIVEAQALTLTAEERARLADRLIASLFEGSKVVEAWAAEVERRIEEIESGRTQLVPAADAIARARAALTSSLFVFVVLRLSS